MACLSRARVRSLPRIAIIAKRFGETFWLQIAQRNRLRKARGDAPCSSISARRAASIAGSLKSDSSSRVVMPARR